LVAHGQLAYLEPGRDATTVRGASGVRVLLLGGTPFGEEIVMWWNFVGRSHDDVAEQRAAWQARSSRFGEVPGYVGDPSWLPAPELPNVRLRPRGNP
ncbi:MAG: pirin-like C-terminal cupin domain-containing protein, partial [Acidimicrobiales bacterium]